MAADLFKNVTDDDLLSEVARRRKTNAAPSLEQQINAANFSGARPGTELPGQSVASNTIMLTRDLSPNMSTAYDRRSTRPAVKYDPTASTQAQVDVIKAAKQRNPNTPADFDSIAGVRQRSEDLAAEMFSKPPKSYLESPQVYDTSRPSKFWQSYANAILGKPNAPLVSKEEADASMAPFRDPIRGAVDTAGKTGIGGAMTKYGYVGVRDASRPPGELQGAPGPQQGPDNQLGPDNIGPDQGPPAMQGPELPPAEPVLPNVNPPASPVLPSGDPNELRSVGNPTVAPKTYPNTPRFGGGQTTRGYAEEEPRVYPPTSPRFTTGWRTRGYDPMAKDKAFRSVANAYNMDAASGRALRAAGRWFRDRITGKPNGLSLF